MMAHNHITFGVACWLGYCALTPVEPSLAGLGFAAAGALLPDIDHPQSAFGRVVRPLSTVIAAVAGHRGVTHSLLAVFVLTLALLWLQGQSLILFGTSPLTGLGAQALAVGALSHLLADALTPSGVPFLWPWKRCFSVNLFPTGSLPETAFTLALGAMAFALAWPEQMGQWLHLVPDIGEAVRHVR